MFNNPRYLTRGISDTIPLQLQMIIWNCIDLLPKERDYLQVFELGAFGGMQQIRHSSEQPAYCKVFLFLSEAPVTGKIYVIDDNDHSTMLLAEEY